MYTFDVIYTEPSEVIHEHSTDCMDTRVEFLKCQYKHVQHYFVVNKRSEFIVAPRHPLLTCNRSIKVRSTLPHSRVVIKSLGYKCTKTFYFRPHGITEIGNKVKIHFLIFVNLICNFDNFITKSNKPYFFHRPLAFLTEHYSHTNNAII